jgi:beta-glucosidase
MTYDASITKKQFVSKRSWSVARILALGAIAAGALCAQTGQSPIFPWMNANLTPDQRANLVLPELTLDEKIVLIHGQGSPFDDNPGPNTNLSNGGDGLSLGIARLGIPSLQMDGAAYGVRFSGINGRYSTALPSNLALAASWDAEAACAYGALIGKELRAQGYNMSLAGGVNLARELRNGRNFEYHGEDPLLAGVMVGHRVRCEQAQHILAELKHYAVNDQETGRGLLNAAIGRRALRETDLLAFEIGNQIARPGAVMCSYNGVNGDYACENKYLLTDVLKNEWGFSGFVLSDWGGTHSTARSSSAGLDMEQPGEDYYGAAMKAAIQIGRIPTAELDEHVRRILRAEFATGIIDHPVHKSVVDVEAGLETARQLAEQSIVLLKNEGRILPLDPNRIGSIAILGEHADSGMISGGGSAQVDPQGSFTVDWKLHQAVWFPTSPLKSIAAMAPRANVQFASGNDLAAAADLAKRSDVAIVFVHQWCREGADLPSLALPANQDRLIAQVAAANPNTIVVLETGTAVRMPWINQVRGIVEAWYAGSKGGEAVARVLFGEVNPSAKLPLSFPVSESDMPHPEPLALPPAIAAQKRPKNLSQPLYTVTYDKALEVGYKWYDAENKPVLFPFGFGLSYTSFRYANLELTPEGPPDAPTVTVRLTISNTGSRRGTETVEIYATLPASADEPPNRLVGWSRVQLNPGQTTTVRIPIEAKRLSIFDEQTNRWKLVPGRYILRAGGSSRDLPLSAAMDLP